MSFLDNTKPRPLPLTQSSTLSTTQNTPSAPLPPTPFRNAPFVGRRHPKNYDGPKKTTWFASDLASLIVKRVTQATEERPDLILAAWADMMGKERADRIQAERFVKGVLYVCVNNSMLFSLIRAREKEQFLSELRRRFPKTPIDRIVFRMG